jgi:predicted phage-related endonuclease
MKIIECIQYSPEWYKARAGIPTASGFDRIITVDEKVSKSLNKYLNQLAGEAIAGIAIDQYQSDAMKRGKELEDEARKLYTLITGRKVEEIGFCRTEGETIYGCSPDGLVGDSGLLEIKCPTIAVHVNYLLENLLPLDYYQQLQGQLLVTGRQWVDFMSYYPGLKPLIVRVKRNEQFLKALDELLKVFCAELKEVIKKIR